MAKGGLVRSRDRWLLGSMMMIFGDKKSQNTNPQAMGIYSGDLQRWEYKAVCDGDASGSCVFQQPVELVLTPKKKEPATVEVGATTRLKDTSRQKCSLSHSSWNPLEWQVQVFQLPHKLQTLEPQHQQALTRISFSSHHYQQLAHGLVECTSCWDH